jgi:RNA polymerase sigma-70 factor (ECF subfamily)
MSRKSQTASADETALVSAAKAGDLGAFEELVARHRDKLFARAFSMVRSQEEAVDLTQEAWIKIWQRLNQFQGGSGFATWATRVLINVCLDFLRKKKRLAEDSVEQMNDESGGVERLLPPIEVNPTKRLEQAELRGLLDEAMAKLTDEHRAVLVLHAYEGLEYKEIAQRVGCSLGTVMSRLFYARRRLAAVLQDINLDEYR